MKRKRKYRASECVGCGEVISHERFHTYGYCAECFQRGLVPLGVIRDEYIYEKETAAVVEEREAAQ